MKVLLVEPPRKVWELMGNCVAPPLGLAQVAAVLEERGIPVRIVDCNASGLSWAKLEKAIAREEPDLVGASAMTPFFPDAYRVTRIAKRVNPHIVTVLGGPHVTFTPEETLQQCPEVDLIVRGEGEETLVRLVEALERGDDLAGVPGIAFRRHGDIELTPPAPPVDLNALPLPAYHLLPTERYHFEFLGRFATVLASRGCPYNCTFCAEWRFWGKWRPRAPRLVLDEIELLHQEYGRESIWFGDDCFNVNGDHMRAIAEGILERGLDVNWFYQGRADFLVRYRDLLPLMRRAGNRMVQIGIEASTDEERDGFRKHLTTGQIRQAVELLRQNDIVCQGLIIVGTPTDSPRTMEHKVRFAKWLDIDFLVLTVYTPFPGSDVWNEARAQGWLKDFNYARYDMAHPLLPTRHLSRKEVMRWTHWCYADYYLDPIKIARGLTSRNPWKRLIWWHMFKFMAKQMIRAWF
ncbi:MAG: B12-binding domain-containing radical SAM protein [Anaerolineae bacterium]